MADNKTATTYQNTEPGALHDTLRPARKPSSLHRLVSTAAAHIIDIITPPVCLHCHIPLTSQDTLCPQCWSAIDFIRPPLCERLGIPLPYDAGIQSVSAEAAAHPPIYARARAVARYDGVMRDMIHDLKFHDRHDARKLFGRWMSETGRDLTVDADVVVPVPLHRFKLLRRRFNQSALLAAEVARNAHLPHAPLALIRTRTTTPQVGLTQVQRKKNVNGAFAVPPHSRATVEGRRILLVDDVITTGATISAATKALLDAGATAVDVLALGLVTDTAATLGS
ncbi:MAG: ComF family protein [Hyphomicrobiaceae bacterium]